MTIHGQVRSVSHENGVALVLSAEQAKALGITPGIAYNAFSEEGTIVLIVHDDAAELAQDEAAAREVMTQYREALRQLAE